MSPPASTVPQGRGHSRCGPTSAGLLRQLEIRARIVLGLPVRPAQRRQLDGAHRRYDPIMHLLRSGSVTQEHALPADRYRIAWELGPGGAMPGYERIEAGSHQYGPSSGPTAERAHDERRWQEVQSLFPVPKQRACLEAIVLKRSGLLRRAVLAPPEPSGSAAFRTMVAPPRPSTRAGPSRLAWTTARPEG